MSTFTVEAARASAPYGVAILVQQRTDGAMYWMFYQATDMRAMESYLASIRRDYSKGDSEFILQRVVLVTGCVEIPVRHNLGGRIG